jgi:hypothetical protein
MKVKFLLFSFLIALNSCVPNSAIPSMPTNGNNGNSPLDPLQPISGDPNPQDPTKPPPSTDPNNPTQPTNPDHPPPPDPQQPNTEDDFWKLMKKFGFFETRTKEDLQADIIKLSKIKITDWSPGREKDKNKNIKNNFIDNKKYFNPPIATVDEYLKKSLALASQPNQNIDFYLDVRYGPKSGKGLIVMQKVDPRTLEILFYNNNGLINNYSQTKRPDAPLLRLANLMFIPPSVYNGK